MKKIIGVILLVFMLSTIAYGADGDITVSEVRPDVATQALYEVHFYIQTKTIRVDYEKQDSDGNRIEEKNVYFRNTVDEEGKPDLTEFTDFITAINNGNNIRTTVMNAVKIKLGIE